MKTDSKLQITIVTCLAILALQLTKLQAQNTGRTTQAVVVRGAFQ